MPDDTERERFLHNRAMSELDASIILFPKSDRLRRTVAVCWTAIDDDDDAPKFKAWYAEVMALIPVEFQDSAVIYSSTVETDDGDYQGTINVEYTRFCNDEEIAALRNRRAERDANLERLERAQLARLRAKYPD